jgi:hypothetical protein
VPEDRREGFNRISDIIVGSRRMANWARHVLPKDNRSISQGVTAGTNNLLSSFACEIGHTVQVLVDTPLI